MNRSLFVVLLVASAAHAAAPGVVVLWSSTEGDSSVVVEQRGESRRELASIAHARGGIARGALTPNGLAVIAQMTDARDASWSSALQLLDAKGQLIASVDRVAHASKPVVTASGEVLVNRGVAGLEPQFVKGFGAPLRIDELTLEAVNASGRSRLLLRRSGYLLFVAGATAGEAIVYAIGPGSTPLLGVDLQSGAVRTIAAHLELARDFTVSARSVVFTESAGREMWRVMKLSLEDGSRQQVARGAFLPFVPFQLPSGVAMNAADGSGLHLGERSLRCAHGAGLDELQASDGKFAAGLHVVDGQMPAVVLFDLERGTSSSLPAMPGLSPAVIGVRP